MLTGWARVAMKQMNLLPDHLRVISENRLKICDKCPMRASNTCSKNRTGTVENDFKYHGKQRTKGQRVKGCGCNLAAKTLEQKEQCPLGKW